MASTTYPDEVWEKIRREWLAGQLSISDIARTYGPSRATIRQRASRKKWGARGSLVDEVRKEIDSQLLEDDTPADVPPPGASEIVETAAKRGVAVVRHQRDLLKRLLDVAGGALEELEELKVIKLESLAKKKTKANVLLIQACTKARIEGMRAVSQVLSQAIPLERIAYKLDDESGQGGDIRYVAPDYHKPRNSGLSEDDWEQEEDAE